MTQLDTATQRSALWSGSVAFLLSLAANVAATVPAGLTAFLAGAATPVVLMLAVRLWYVAPPGSTRWRRFLGFIAMCAVVAPVAVGSYYHAGTVLLGAGYPVWLAWATPASVDGLAVRGLLAARPKSKQVQEPTVPAALLPWLIDVHMPPTATDEWSGHPAPTPTPVPTAPPVTPSVAPPVTTPVEPPVTTLAPPPGMPPVARTVTLPEPAAAPKPDRAVDAPPVKAKTVTAPKPTSRPTTKPTEKPTEKSTATDDVDMDDLIKRTRAIIAEQGTIGQKRLSVELGVSKHYAAKALDAVKSNGHRPTATV